jgi:hypothetical protein
MAATAYRRSGFFFYFPIYQYAGILEKYPFSFLRPRLLFRGLF